ncbi:major facilitator superfamily domain-containing protein [Talaromyces proteolyticus]|uniref:Major facilitator superfamily domain-containing protein n=1 Tax=Talaromyces proteolyticus TaxID=1131652 RepID=A0AAD4PZX3_9EURO|nr:major facilitator superfamily domain-containing protein [Talaromyces proteolyticus]KAH8703473.1 major facilitator superfamily domain-containing protein [Talaromyces proteolyticus]
MTETGSGSTDLQPELEKQPSTTPAEDIDPPKRQDETAESGDPDLVDWDGPTDPHNPQNWSNARKWCLVTLVSAVTCNISMASTVAAPAVPAIMDHFHNSNLELESFVVSIYIIGFVFGPLLVAPLSELYGRSIILHVTNVLFFIFNIACAVSTDLPMFIVFRLIVGLMASTPLTLGGGFIADLMVAEKRARALTIWTMGPVIGGFLSQGAGWRWVLWFVVIISGTLTLACFIFVRETYSPVLLIRKAARLRKETGNPKLHSKFDSSKTAYETFSQAIIRPTKMLLFAPIVTILALYIALIYTYMYLLFTTFTFIFEEQYGFNSGEAGLAYLGTGIGFILGLFVTGFYSDKVVRKIRKTQPPKPEHHLPPMAVGAILLPIGLFFYGWTAQYAVHWIVPIIATGFFGLGLLLGFMPVQVYLVETYTIYAASAIASNTVLRSLFGAVVPLAGQKMYATLGYGWGNSLLGFIALIFIPAPFALLKYGEQIRTNPRFQVKL